MIRRLVAPSALAASTKSCSRSDSTTARTTRAASGHVKRAMNSTTISSPVPTMPTTIAIAISAGIARMVSVPRMISVSTQPPKMPGDQPHDEADARREQRRDHADRERDATGVQQACEQVATEAVGAEWMRCARRAELRAQVRGVGSATL